VRSHVADLILEAWGPDRIECLAAAVTGLVGTFADASGVRPEQSVEFVIGPASDADLLVHLLEEVVYLVDAEGIVPVDVTLAERDGGLAGRFATVSVEQVREVGAVPKGVSRSGAELTRSAAPGPARWRGHVVVDV
jgi:SHS2 domain-containing protein